MQLKYISLNLNRQIFGNEYGYEFMLHTRFISNYFSKAIRKYKFETDGSFDKISIDGSEQTLDPKIVPMNALKINLEFNKLKYAKIKGTNNFEYYLELLEEGFALASKFKQIPLNILLDILAEFRRNNCKNEWLHKKKKSIAYDLEIMLTCEFTTNYFRLMAIVTQISTKKELIRGPVIITEPDEVLYDKMFKDIIIDDDSIIITDAADSPRIVINKVAIFLGKLRFDVIGDENIRKILSYELKN